MTTDPRVAENLKLRAENERLQVFERLEHLRWAGRNGELIEERDRALDRESALRSALAAATDAIAWMQDRIEPMSEAEEIRLYSCAVAEGAARRVLKPEPVSDPTP